MPSPLTVHHRVGGWLPQDHNVLRSWLDKKISLVEHGARKNAPFHPIIQQFKDFIEGDPVIYTGFHQMFE